MGVDGSRGEYMPKLNKSLYGINQASKIGWKYFNRYLKEGLPSITGGSQRILYLKTQLFLLMSMVMWFLP